MSLLTIIKCANDHIWWTYSAISVFPLLIISIYKLCNPVIIHIYHDKNPFPRTKIDKIAKIFLFFAPFYYLIDVVSNGLRFNFYPCKAAFFLHHLISSFFLPIMIKQNYYPWFCLAVPSFHAFLIIFPEVEFLNFIYLGICMIYHYGLYQHPFTIMKDFNLLKIGTILLEISLILLWLLGCKNTFDEECIGLF